MKKEHIIPILILALIVYLVIAQPFGGNKESDFGGIISAWGDQQANAADEITTGAVSNLEGKYVGEHKVDGSNWSIPNILRNLFK